MNKKTKALIPIRVAGVSVNKNDLPKIDVIRRMAKVTAKFVNDPQATENIDAEIKASGLYRKHFK